MECGFLGLTIKHPPKMSERDTFVNLGGVSKGSFLREAVCLIRVKLESQFCTI